MSESVLKDVSAAMKAGDPLPILEKLDAQAADAAAAVPGEGIGIEAVMNIPVTVQIVLGSTTIPISHLMTLSRGAILPLENKVGEPVDVVVNGRVIARGELVVMDDDSSQFGVSLTEVVGTQPAEGAG